MPPPDLPRIETERLLLRPITEDDLGVWTRLVWGDPEVMKYHNASPLTPEERAARTLAWHARNWSELGCGGLLIIDKRTETVFGDCYLGPADEAGEIELGYSIGQDYWGRGIATEASKAMVRFGFERAGLERIAGFAMPVNVGSWRVLEKAGFTYERDDFLFSLDVRCFAIEVDEYEPDDSFYRVHDY